MTTRDLLFELGTEELPPQMLQQLSCSLRDGLGKLFNEYELSYAEIKPFASPRRLAVLVTELAQTQQDRFIEHKGPKVSIAYDENGQPTKACTGFAKSCGTTVDQLQIKTIGNESKLFYSYTQPGKPALELLPDILKQTVSDLPIRKSMRWGAHPYPFIRPVHWVTALYGEEIVAVDILNQKAGEVTYGHRFHHPQPIKLESPQAYESRLEHPGHVIADLDKRKQNIRTQINSQTRTDETAIIDEDLLEEVAGLVEWPVALRGTFDERFLAVPQEALISAIQNHQKSFGITDASDNLKAAFITLANIDSRDPRHVIQGNERVVKARLADAEFFYEQDSQTPLASRVNALADVLFQRQLGSLYDKTQRMVMLTRHFCEQTGIDNQAAVRAALLAKTDLITEMVDEFPELQGTMGYYYAKRDGEPEAVAVAVGEHYHPRYANDSLPQSMAGAIVSLADRLDTLTGIFGIQQYPTGEKDPFALRRAALGVLRILIEKRLDLDLFHLIKQAVQSYEGQLPNHQISDELFAFIMERLKAWYLEQGTPARQFSAVQARHPQRPHDFHRRLKAVQQFLTLPEAESLATANKRVGNILRKQGQQAGSEVSEQLLVEPAEQQLAQAMDERKQQVQAYYEAGHYTEALTELAALKPAVDRFFDEVRVMTDDPDLTANRLALLRQLRELFTQVADISLL